MQKITVSKDNQELTYNGWQSVHRELFGSDVPISAKNCTIKLNKEGWSVINIEGVSKKAVSKSSIIERLIKECSTVDSVLIKSKKDEMSNLLAVAITDDEMARVFKLRDEIKVLENPTATLKDIVEYVKQLYKEHHEEA